jgi:hypothetical protein
MIGKSKPRLEILVPLVSQLSALELIDFFVFIRVSTAVMVGRIKTF